MLCSENRFVYEIMWKNVITAIPATDENIRIIRRMHFACRMTEITDTGSEYVTLLL